MNNSEKIGLRTATIVGMNAMIGAGIIAVPSLLASATGPAGILTFIFSIFVVLLIGLSLGAVAHRYPGEGWNYLYPSKWGGHALGMVSAWAYFIGVVIAMGFLVQQAGLYTHRFISGVDPIILGVAILVILTLLVLSGSEISSFGQYVIIFFVLAPMLTTSLFCWFHFNSDLLTPFMPYGFQSIFSAAPRALFGFFGFESIASLYSVVQSPNKNVPRACVLAVSCVGSLYLFFSAGALFSIMPEHFAAGVRQTLDSVIISGFPNYTFLATFILVGALFAIIGTLHSMIWSLSVLLTSILKRMRMPLVVNMLKQGRWNNNVSVLIVSSLMLILALKMTGETLVDLTAFCIVPSYMLSIAALLFIKEEWASGGNVRTLLALGGASIMFYFASQPVLNIFRMLF